VAGRFLAKLAIVFVAVHAVAVDAQTAKGESLAGSAAGQPLQVDRVPFNVFAEGVLRRVSDRPFVLCDAVLNDKRPVSLRLEPHQLNMGAIRGTFAAYGFELKERGGVVYGCGANGASSGFNGRREALVHGGGPDEVPARRSGVLGPRDASRGDYRPSMGAGDALPVGSPLSPAQPRLQPAVAMVPFDAELIGLRMDYVAPATVIASLGPMFPELKTSIVEGGGQRPALFVQGERSEVERFKKMAGFLDRPPEAVEVQAIVLEVSDGSRTGFGVSMVLDVIRSGVGFTIAGEQQANQLTFKSGSFDAVLSAVTGSSNVRVVSSPRLRGRSGEKLRLQVGSDVPTLGAVVENAGGSTTQSIQYRSSGVIFEVEPTVFGKRIGVSVHQELSAFAETETGVRGSPTLSTRALDTSLDLESGEWAVVGGLTASEDQTQRQSLLGLVPIGKTRTTRKSELVILLNVRRVERSVYGDK
jgi:hypothetical protein